MIYLHGFASGPSSKKAQAFVRRFSDLDITLSVPQLDEDDFENLTITRMKNVVRKALDQTPAPHVLIGSSLGGYLSLLHAADHPVDALILMAPAVNFHPRLVKSHGEEALGTWRSAGFTEVDHYVHLRPMRLSSNFLSDAEAHDPAPSVHVPTLVFHGKHDDVVPLEQVAYWVDHEPTADLVELDDDHGLSASTERIIDESIAFLSRLPTIRARWPKLAA